MLIYSEMLNNGWANWGYNSTLNFNNSTPVHSGNYSISATMPAWSRIWFIHDPIDTTLYTNFTFWVNGGPSGGQYLQVAASTNGVDGTWINIGPLQTNAWQQVTISLAALGVANQTNLNYLWINNWSGTAQPVFYLDDVLIDRQNAAHHRPCERQRHPDRAHRERPVGRCQQRRLGWR